MDIVTIERNGSTNNSYDNKTNQFETLSQLPGDLYQYIDLIFNCYLLLGFAMFGLVGTTINIIVLSSYDITKDSSNILLVSLSVADFIFCITIPIRRCQCLVAHIADVPTATSAATFMTEYMFVFNRLFYCISITVVGAIAAERFLVVFYPFNIKRLLSPFNMKAAVISVYVLNLIFISPGFGLFQHEWIYDTNYQQDVAVLKFSQFYESNYDTLNFHFTIIYNTGLLGLSMTLTLVFTPAIGLRIWILTKERRKLTKKVENVDSQTAKILVTVCITSLIVHGPGILFDSVVYFIPNYIYKNMGYEIYEIMADFSGTLSASSNFIIYVTMSSKFKQRYRMLFRGLGRPILGKDNLQKALN